MNELAALIYHSDFTSIDLPEWIRDNAVKNHPYQFNAFCDRNKGSERYEKLLKDLMVMRKLK